jgi:hypothetical protein
MTPGRTRWCELLLSDGQDCGAGEVRHQLDTVSLCDTCFKGRVALLTGFGVHREAPARNVATMQLASIPLVSVKG